MVSTPPGNVDLVLQFGAGNFLRAFVCRFVQEMNDAEQAPALSVVVVQSTDGERARLLEVSGGRFHVVVRGLENGQVVERVQQIGSIARAFIAAPEWPAVLEVARSPRLAVITSNTTEAGLSLAPEDNIPPSDTNSAPHSFPAKLTAVLWERFHASLPGPLILPCELIADNADVLRSLVLKQAAQWNWNTDDFTDWLTNICTWSNTLVDGIVSGRPEPGPNQSETVSALLESDPLMTVAEPFRFWAMENKPGTERVAHTDIHRVPDVRPYALRKVRILNGAHTALVARVRQQNRTDLRFVREAVADADLGPWLRGLLFEEIVPTVAARVPDAEIFAHQTLERFANPYLDHRLSDIALHHDTKVQVRLVPTCQEYQDQRGHAPSRLNALLKEQ